jgi:ATP synthase F0 subunit b
MLALLAVVDEATPNGAWFPHDINEVIWGTIAFVLVMGLLVWKAGPALKKAMNGRTERIQSELDVAAGHRTDAERERDRIRAALADSDTEAARIVEEARVTAERLATQIAARTESDIAALRERSIVDLDATRRQAIADLTAEVSRLSLGAAERVVSHHLDDTSQQELIEQYIARVGTNN